MPQLDTSTWFITVLSTLITLFIFMQLKVSSQEFPLTPLVKSMDSSKVKNPWELKWMKIYLPLLLPLQ